MPQGRPQTFSSLSLARLLILDGMTKREAAEKLDVSISAIAKRVKKESYLRAVKELQEKALDDICSIHGAKPRTIAKRLNYLYQEALRARDFELARKVLGDLSNLIARFSPKVVEEMSEAKSKGDSRHVKPTVFLVRTTSYEGEEEIKDISAPPSLISSSSFEDSDEIDGSEGE